MSGFGSYQVRPFELHLLRAHSPSTAPRMHALALALRHWSSVASLSAPALLWQAWQACWLC